MEGQGEEVRAERFAARGAGSVSVASVVKLLDVAEALGADRSSMIAKVGVAEDRLAQPEAHVPLPLQHQLWEIALEGCGDRALPLRVAERCDPSTFQVLGYACMTAANVREALDRLTRFLSLFLQGETITVEHDEGETRLVLHQSSPKRVGRELSAESTIGKIVVVFRMLVESGAAWNPSLVTFAHPAPDRAEAFETLFRCPVRFGAARTEFVIPGPMLDRRLAKADPGLSAFFERHAEETLARMGARSDVTARVRRAVTEALHAGDVSETNVARRLGWSERTLRRRLGEETTTFRNVLDDVRRELAQSWLVQSEMAIGEVAFLLGFSESSNFHRAFKRWTGQTPDEFRRSQR